MSLSPGTRLGPYEVVSLLGAGGMGEVWLAEDPRLGRRVALKRPPADALASAEVRARLEREARAAARLNHPGIAAVYDVLDHEGQLHIVMEYVEGDTLAALLRRGPVSIEQAVDVGAQLADALAAAHAAQVVHRDLKPSNVVLTPNGRVKVLDFGIARVGGVRADRRATSGGLVFGTPGYTPPEQLLGAEADPRGDIYSAGAVLYELITGRPPFVGDSTTDLKLAALTATPPRIQDLNPAAPVALAAIVERALARQPADRYATAAQLRTDLTRVATSLGERPTVELSSEAPTAPFEPAAGAPRATRMPQAKWVAAVVIVALAAGVGIPLARRWRAAPVPAPGVQGSPVVAVLPLENLSGDPSKEYLGAGIAETLTMALSKMNTLRVLSRAEVLEAVRRGRESRRVARELGASYLVDGSVQESGARLRVTLRLVLPDGKVSWSDAYEGATGLVFDLQRQMGGAVVQRFQATLGGPPAEPPPVPTTNVEALTEYWKGRSTLEQATTLDQVSAAVVSFSRAIELDAKFALGYAGLADAYWQHYQLSHESAMTRRALDAGLTALGLDPNQADVRVAVANIYLGVGQYEEAAQQLEHALALQPANDNAHRVFAKALVSQGKGDEAIAALQKAIDVRSGRWLTYYDLGGVYYRLRRLPEAAAAYQRALELLPNDVRIYNNLGAVYAQMWDNERALDNFERANRLVSSRRGFSNIGQIRYRLGRFKDAVEAYEQALKLDPKGATTRGNLGDAYLRLGRAEDARREFQRARELSLEDLKVNARDASTLAALARFEAKLGMHEQADKHVANAVALTPSDPDVLYKRAVVDALAGRPEAAVQALERAIRSGFVRRWAREDYDLVSLRASPAFQALVAER
jgi:serine/threonine-protein kinase